MSAKFLGVGILLRNSDILQVETGNNWQLKNTEPTIKNVVKYLLNGLGGFKFFITLFFKFKKTVNKDETKCSTFYLNSEAETVIHDADIDSVYESIYITIMTKIQKYQAEGSG